VLLSRATGGSGEQLNEASAEGSSRDSAGRLQRDSSWLQHTGPGACAGAVWAPAVVIAPAVHGMASQVPTVLLRP
jgi:hypothetical protein